MSDTRTLGTLLRHLIDLLDGAVEQSYRDAGLNYRPRYTPVVRALLDQGPGSIGAIARYAGMTHSAASQTVAHMDANGLLDIRPGEDARERVVALSDAALAVMPEVQRRWRATEAAVRELEADIGAPLAAVAADAIAALERRPLADRIRDHILPGDTP